MTELSENFDEWLNNREGLLGQLRSLGIEISADNIGEGVFGATSTSNGIMFGVNPATNNSYLQSRNFVTGTTGWQLLSDGSIEAKSITLTGGTIKYGKTSFTDSTNAGYYIGSEGIYFGAASDATKLKYTISSGAFDFIGTVSGRATNALAYGDSSGNLINATLDTSAKTILSDFTFSPSDYSGAFKTGDIVWNTTTGAITSGTGIVINKYGIIGALVGATTFSILTDGSATFGGTLIAASGTFGTVTAGTLTGVTITGSTIKAVETFTAGESLTAGNVVCLKNGASNTSPSYDTYVAEISPDTNYDTSETLKCGIENTKNNYVYFKFATADITPAAEQILKATLYFYVTNTYADSRDITVTRATTDWTSSTMTWNTGQPSVTSDTYEPGGIYTVTVGSAQAQFYSLDITDLVRNWKNTKYSSYGVRMYTTGNRCVIASQDNPTAGYRPYIEIISTGVCDSKVYKTDSDDYLLCRNVIGIATETKSTDQTCKVQTFGKNTDVTASSGEKYYLSPTAGAITNSVASQARLYRLGFGTASNELMIEKDDANLFIASILSKRIVAASTSHYVPIPPDATYAIITYVMEVGWTILQNQGNVRIDVAGVTSQTVQTNSSDGVSAGKSFSVSIGYSSNGNVLTVNSGNASVDATNYFLYSVYFFK